MISEIKISFLWLAIILQCVVKKLPIRKYKENEQKKQQQQQTFSEEFLYSSTYM